MIDKRPSDTRVQMSEIMTPTDVNLHGKVFGGRLLSMIDLAAYTAASRFSGCVCVTASFDRVDFHEPIEIGEVVQLSASVTYAGRTSIEVTIHVTAEDILTGDRRHTNTARVTMVALKDGKPFPVPRLICESREDKIGFLEGRLRKELRGIQSYDYERIHSSFVAATDMQLDDLLTAESLI